MFVELTASTERYNVTAQDFHMTRITSLHVFWLAVSAAAALFMIVALSVRFR
jgi:hypothetical protein